MLAKRGATELCEAAAVLRQCVDALLHLHSRGIVHRDVKPSNICFASPISDLRRSSLREEQAHTHASGACSSRDLHACEHTSGSRVSGSCPGRVRVVSGSGRGQPCDSDTMMLLSAVPQVNVRTAAPLSDDCTFVCVVMPFPENAHNASCAMPRVCSASACAPSFMLGTRVTLTD